MFLAVLSVPREVRENDTEVNVVFEHGGFGREVFAARAQLVDRRGRVYSSSTALLDGGVSIAFRSLRWQLRPAPGEHLRASIDLGSAAVAFHTGFDWGTQRVMNAVSPWFLVLGAEETTANAPTSARLALSPLHMVFEGMVLEQMPALMQHAFVTRLGEELQARGHAPGTAMATVVGAVQPGSFVVEVRTNASHEKYTESRLDPPDVPALARLADSVGKCEFCLIFNATLHCPHLQSRSLCARPAQCARNPCPGNLVCKPTHVASAGGAGSSNTSRGFFCGCPNSFSSSNCNVSQSQRKPAVVADLQAAESGGSSSTFTLLNTIAVVVAAVSVALTCAIFLASKRTRNQQREVFNSIDGSVHEQVAFHRRKGGRDLPQMQLPLSPGERLATAELEWEEGIWLSPTLAGAGKSPERNLRGGVRSARTPLPKHRRKLCLGGLSSGAESSSDDPYEFASASSAFSGIGRTKKNPLFSEHPEAVDHGHFCPGGNPGDAGSGSGAESDDAYDFASASSTFCGSARTTKNPLFSELTEPGERGNLYLGSSVGKASLGSEAESNKYAAAASQGSTCYASVYGGAELEGCSSSESPSGGSSPNIPYDKSAYDNADVADPACSTAWSSFLERNFKDIGQAFLGPDVEFELMKMDEVAGSPTNAVYANDTGTFPQHAMAQRGFFGASAQETEDALAAVGINIHTDAGVDTDLVDGEPIYATGSLLDARTLPPPSLQVTSSKAKPDGPRMALAGAPPTQSEVDVYAGGGLVYANANAEDIKGGTGDGKVPGAVVSADATAPPYAQALDSSLRRNRLLGTHVGPRATYVSMQSSGGGSAHGAASDAWEMMSSGDYAQIEGETLLELLAPDDQS